MFSSTLVVMRYLLAIMLLVASCANSSPPEPEARPGSAEVYLRIEASYDCDELQGEFDRAADSFDRSEKGTDKSTMFLAYMKAADKRMTDVGCLDQ